MFKSLREKINVSDSNSRIKKISNTNPDDNNDDNEGFKISGDQNLSRFSSISSLVSDVGSVFSKGLSIPQSTNKSSKQFYDNESVSEYDDSIVQGNVLNKEELFLKYQRAQSLAKRYKTRSLEVVESYKRLELENTKLIQTLTESQDCNIRRVGELREENELTTKAKNDVEENYRLMIDEDRELVNVLRLQISLLKEGKDLPVELESQIKERHDMEVQAQKKKDEEIRELRSNMSHHVDSLQQCKENIASLKSQLSEVQAKYDSVTRDSEQLNTDLVRQRSQHVAALENIQKEHSERIKDMLREFEENKVRAETAINEEHEQRLSTIKRELNDMKDKMSRMSQDNERLEEQVNIKTKIIEEIMSNQDLDSRKPKETYSTVVDHSSSYEIPTLSSLQEHYSADKQEEVVDLREEIKFLYSRIEQMENLKSQTEEETSKTEEEIKIVESKLKSEREDWDMKCKSYELKLDEVKSELNLAISRGDGLNMELSNLNSVLSKKKSEIEELIQDNRDADAKYKNLDEETRKIKEEKFELSSRYEKAIKDFEELEHQLHRVNVDYDNDKVRFTEQCMMYTKIQDKYDELSSRLEKEICEKNKLSSLLNYTEKDIENTVIDEDGLGLRIVEMRQRYDHQIEECKEQMNSLDTMIRDKDLKIQELELELRSLTCEYEDNKRNLVSVQTLKDEIAMKLNKLHDDVTEYKSIIEDMEKGTLRDREGHAKMMKENQQFLINNENLMSNLNHLSSELEELQLRMADMDNENISFKIELEAYKSRGLEFVGEKGRLEKECVDKDEQIRIMNEYKIQTASTMAETNKLNDAITMRNVKLEMENEGLMRDRDVHLKVIREKEDSIINLGNDHGCIAILESTVPLTSELDSLQLEIESMTRENDFLKNDLEQYKLRSLEFFEKSRKFEEEGFDKDEQIRILNEDKLLVVKSLTDAKITNEDLINRTLKLEEKDEELNQELMAINARMLLLEQFETKYTSLLQECAQLKSDYDALQKKLSDVNDCNVSLQRCVEDSERRSENTIPDLQRSLAECEDNLRNHKETIDNLEGKIGIFGKYLNIFQKWSEDVVVISDCNDEDDLSNAERLVYWTNDHDVGCGAIEEISSLGRCIERTLLYIQANHKSLKKTCDENDKFKKLITDVCATTEDHDKEFNQEEVLRRLLDIRAEIDKKDMQIVELKDYCNMMEQVLMSDDYAVTDTCLLSESRKNIIERVSYLKKQLCSKEGDINSLQSEKEIMLQKIEKNNSNKIQHFKSLVDMFGLTDVDCDQKGFCNTVMRGLNEHVTKHSSLLSELKEAGFCLRKVEQELNASIEECKSKHSELHELREKLDSSDSALVTTGQELDLLKISVDDRVRVEEERQSSAKEVKELNEKIQDMNLNFERQRDKSQELEKKFIEMLEKIKANHLALTESYSQFDLKEQQFISSEETSTEVIENEHSSNLMLNEVLQLSQQLLVLNNAYKESLERSHAETKKVTESLKQSELKCDNIELILRKLKDENAGLCDNVEELRKAYQEVLNEQDSLKIELDTLLSEKEKSTETVVQLRSVNRSTEDALKDRNETTEKRLAMAQQSLDKMKNDYDKASNDILNLTKILDEERRNHSQLRSEIGEKSVIIKSYETKIELVKTELKNMKEEHEREIFEIKQQFNEDKSGIDDDHNRRVKKLAKDFNEKVLEKEQDFQKTFQDALENVRNEEGRQKADLKYQIDQLNHIVIELEAEKNCLFNTITDGEQDLKNAKTSILSKEAQLQSLQDEISSYQYQISDLEEQILKTKSLAGTVEQRSKINQTVNAHSYYDDQSLDTDSANDHDVLTMHCTDLEDQVRQLHVENMSLKQTMASNTLSPSTLLPQEHITATKSFSLTNQSSLDNASLKSSNIVNPTFLRSPNTSCSEYQFCPYPITEATEYEYLRDILIKYMTGLETDTLARVLCTVMKFSRDETDRIVRFEHDKRKVIQVRF